jgi:hypothetical protein
MNHKYVYVINKQVNFALLPTTLAQEIILITCIGDVLNLIFPVALTILINALRGFLQVLQRNAGIVP